MHLLTQTVSRVCRRRYESIIISMSRDQGMRGMHLLTPTVGRICSRRYEVINIYAQESGDAGDATAYKPLAELVEG